MVSLANKTVAAKRWLPPYVLFPHWVLTFSVNK
uniref:Uncharacterized protein n=1 Tax=Anguilla anguilla TaxID=7936 RepID=A0A0E9PHB0_ANGAN